MNLIHVIEIETNNSHIGLKLWNDYIKDKKENSI